MNRLGWYPMTDQISDYGYLRSKKYFLFGVGVFLLIIASGVSGVILLIPWVSEVDIQNESTYLLDSKEEVLVDVDLHPLWSEEERFVIQANDVSQDVEVWAVFFLTDCDDMDDIITWDKGEENTWTFIYARASKTFFQVEGIGSSADVNYNGALKEGKFAEAEISMEDINTYDDPEEPDGDFCLYLSANGDAEITVNRTTESGIKPLAYQCLIWGLWLAGMWCLIMGIEGMVLQKY